MYHLLVLLCLLCLVSAHASMGRYEKPHTWIGCARCSAVLMRRDGLGIAVRGSLWLATKASGKSAQFRRRGALRPLQPASQQKEKAVLFDWPRGDHLHTEHRDTAVKWCKSCPSRRARDHSRWRLFWDLGVRAASFLLQETVAVSRLPCYLGPTMSERTPREHYENSYFWNRE